MGWVRPITEAQKHFVACCRGEVDSASELERLWCRYINWVREVEAPREAAAERIAELEFRVAQLRDICENGEYEYEASEELAYLEEELWNERGF